MSFDANGYNITVRRIIVDDACMFEARVTELPDVRGFGESAGEAHSKAVEAVEALHEMALRDHEEFPEPEIPEDEFSGRVTLRMSKSLHRAAALRAQTEDVSLNSYIVECVAMRLENGVTIQTTGFGPAITAVGGRYVAYPAARMPVDFSKFGTFSDVMLQSVIGGTTKSVGAQVAVGSGTLSWGDPPPAVEPLFERRRRA